MDIRGNSQIQTSVVPLVAGCVPVCGPLSVLQEFERRASASPDALALVCEGRQVTYRELNLTADRVAGVLREAGGGGAMVGVLLDRSPDLIAALFGIWKAGGVYIPLDLAAPPKRLAFMLEDCAPPFVFTRRKFVGQLPAPTERVIDLGDLCILRSPTDRRPLPLAGSIVSGDSPAYVVYTSGSTGTPKGASITHRGLANTIHAVARDLMLGPDDIVLAWSTIAFDVACLEICLPLAFGASLYLVEKELVSGGGARIEQLRRSAATVMFGTPTMYRLLLEEGWQGGANMQLVVGGEVLPLTLARSLAGICRALWNQYGPTETAICATRARIHIDVEKITIGHPLPNVTVHLLDRRLQPVPQGSTGELYIGGLGVGLGYLHRPELTRACFLPDPFAGGSQARMYKSGDLAVELPDGSFDFLGRADDQVKIRGFRIELGEIESALRQCEGVQAAVVRAIELEEDDRRLVAFVVGDGNSLMTRWKESLRQQLPSYMIPSEFVSLPYLPTTPSGKVDGLALDAMRLNQATLRSAPRVHPVDAIEARLKAIWERLLNVKTVGIYEDFFDLGGHSLLAARMLVQIEKQFGCKLPPSLMVENPTIHGLGTYLRQTPGGKWPALATIQAGAHLPPLFIAHGVGGSLLSFIELAAQLGREQPVYGLQLPAFIDEHQAQLKVLAANYLRQVRAIQPSGPYNFAGHSSGGLVVFEMACQLREAGEAIGLLALLDCDPDTGKFQHRPFRDWDSLKASFRRARAELDLSKFGVKDLLRRRIDYQKIKIRTWLAARSRRGGTVRDRLVGAEGYLALAMRDYEWKPYRGNLTLLIAQDEPGSNTALTRAWMGRIIGSCETLLIPGTHGTILAQPQVISLAREIRQRLPGNVEAGARTMMA
jgi:amino acid adenylation domain-containing protein